MPKPTSSKQIRFLAWAAHAPGARKKSGIAPGTARRMLMEASPKARSRAMRRWMGGKRAGRKGKT